ncbi:MAG: VCBS repeat-containing protein [Deltaproteobacteria bacterium]|nr:VCBS repeat-containing protein [Deltaproteobacteria bacterium]
MADTASAVADGESDAGGGWHKSDVTVDSGGDAGGRSGKPVFTGPTFVDRAAELGIDVTQTYAHCTLAADFDGDGALEVGLVRVQFVLGEGWSAALRIFRPGTPTWTLVSETAIDTTQLIPNTGCGLVDLEDDGIPDVVVGGVGGLRTLRNKGDASFVDVTETAVPELMGRDVWSIAGADLDHDGDGDIVLGNGLVYGACADLSCTIDQDDFLCLHPPPPPAKVWSDLEVLRDVLWRREGAAWVDASSALTVVDDGELSQVVPYDVDGDGRLDLVVGHDFGAHAILRALPEGGYVAVQSGLRGLGHTMGWAMGDFDADGRDDLVMADLGPMSLYRSAPAPLPGAVTFVDIGPAWGLADATRDTSVWTPLAEDFDHDGRLDLFLGTSAVAEPGALASFVACVGAQKPAAQQVDLFLHNRGGHFDVYPVAAPMTKLGIERLAQTAIDIDGDGDLDVVQVRFDGIVRVLVNELPVAGPALQLRVVGQPGNRLGTGVRVSAQVAGARIERQLQANLGFGGGARLVAHLPRPGGATPTSIEVRWAGPKGPVSTLDPADAPASGLWLITPPAKP